MLGTFSHLNGNNRLVCKVSLYSTCTMLYSVHYSSKQYRGYKLGNTIVGQLWLIIPKHLMEISLFCGLFCTCGMQKYRNNRASLPRRLTLQVSCFLLHGALTWDCELASPSLASTGLSVLLIFIGAATLPVKSS